MSKNRKDKIKIGDICEFKDVKNTLLFVSQDFENSEFSRGQGRSKNFIFFYHMDSRINDISQKVLILGKQSRYTDVYLSKTTKSWKAVYICYLLEGRNKNDVWLVPSKYIKHSTFDNSL